MLWNSNGFIKLKTISHIKLWHSHVACFIMAFMKIARCVRLLLICDLFHLVCLSLKRGSNLAWAMVSRIGQTLHYGQSVNVSQVTTNNTEIFRIMLVVNNLFFFSSYKANYLH